MAEIDTLQQAIEFLPDPVNVLDAEGNIVYMNGRARRLFGYEQGELLGEPSCKLVPVRLREAHQLGLKSYTGPAGPDPAPMTYDTVMVDKFGTEVPVNVSLGTVRTWSGMMVVASLRPLAWLRPSPDGPAITAETTGLLRSGMKDLAVYTADQSGRIIGWSRGAEAMYGYSESEILGQHVSRLFRPEDAAARLPDLFLQKASAQDQSQEVGWRTRKDGSRFWAALTRVPFRDEQGRLRGFSTIMQDITARLAAERELLRQSAFMSAALEGSQSGVLMFDSDGVCTVANPCLVRDLKCGSGEVSGERSVLSNECPPRYYRVEWMPVVAANREQMGQYWAFRDITREFEIEQMKNDMISIASHELRTPMAAIKGALALIAAGRDESMRAEYRELLDIANRNAERVVCLINDLLDLARLEAGRVELKCRPTDLHELIREAASELDSIRREQNLQLRLEPGPAVPAVLVDPDRILQVLVNLLGNAYKFTPPGGTVTIRLEIAAGEVLLRTSDTGPGIPPNQLTKVFEHFHRVPAGDGHARPGPDLASPSPGPL